MIKDFFGNGSKWGVKLKYLEEAVSALENIHLSNDECKMLETPYKPHPMVTVEMNEKKTTF